MRICIDPGHHVSVNGKRSPQVPPGIIEWEFDMSVAMCLESLLLEAGHDAFRTMQISEPVNKPLAIRQAMANGCDLFVSIHANAAQGSGWSSANGFVVHHNSFGESLAVSIASTYQKQIPEIRARFGGIKHSMNLGVLPRGIPAVLVETLFMTNIREAEFAADPKNQERISRAISCGMLGYIDRKKANA